MSENWDTSKDEFGSFKRDNQPNEECSDVTTIEVLQLKARKRAFFDFVLKLYFSFR